MITNPSQDRPWNDPGPRRGKQSDQPDTRPILRAIVLDFSSVNFVDATSIQALVDSRNQLARHANPEVVEWHFANITDRWTKRALVANGFGFVGPEEEQSLNVTLNIAAAASAAAANEAPVVNEKGDVEARGDAITPVESNEGSVEGVRTGGTVYGANWPFFHVDLRTATKNAVENARRKNSAGSF